MKKKTTIIIGIAIAVIIAVAGYYVAQKPHKTNPGWVISGPFAISKPQYKLGENVFMSVNNLKPNEIGNIFIVTPQNKTFTMIPFNGTAKDHFNYYFRPDTSKGSGIKSTDELIGKWHVLFDLVKYDPISFEVLNETLPGFTPGVETQIEKLMKPPVNKTG